LPVKEGYRTGGKLAKLDGGRGQVKSKSIKGRKRGGGGSLTLLGP